MKRICSAAVCAALCAAALLPPFSASAYDAATYEEYSAQLKQAEASQFPDPEADYTVVTEGDFEYHIYDEFAVLSECRNTALTEAVIPAEAGGLPVVGCLDTPFGFCRSLTAIRLPDCFAHFTWYNLVDTMVTRLGSTEEPMPTVSEVTVSGSHPLFTVSEGMLFSKDMKTLIGCPPAMEVKALQLPEETDTIGDFAMYACMLLETAIVPEHVQHINCSAFAACLNLKRAELPTGITSLAGDTFSCCRSLTDVTFRGELKTIGFGAFLQCEALTDFQIPETVTYIGKAAFDEAGCVEPDGGLLYVQNWAVGSEEHIERAVIRKGTVGIAELSFLALSSLTYIEVPASVKYLGHLCFGASPAGAATVLHFRGSVLPETAISAEKNATDIYLYDPDCVIFDSARTIPAEYRYVPDGSADPGSGLIIGETAPVTGDIVIHGYAGSSAEAYAAKYERSFAVIEPDGDIDCDGACRLSDAVLLQKWLLACPGTEMENWKACDLDRNGKLSAADLSLLKRLLTAQESTGA